MHGQQATDRPSSPRTYEKGNAHELIIGEDLKEYNAHLLRFSQVSKHRHTLYGKLGVHNSHDAILAGYHVLCFSPLEDLTPRVAETGYEIQWREAKLMALPGYR